MRRGRTLFALGLAIGSTLLAGCATQQPYLNAGEARLGQPPYQVGPVTVVVRSQPEVEMICRLRAPFLAPVNARIQGCYVPTDHMIVSTPDPYVLLHEFKHHFEGDWHHSE